MPTRRASAQWQGTLKEGSGRFSGETGLGAQYNFLSRFESGTGSNPEELLAAAEAACFSMALSVGLEKNGTPPRSVKTDAHCTVEKVGEGFQITTMKLDVVVDAPGLENDALQRIAEDTKNGCPVSKAIKGNVDLQLDARLA